MERTLLSFPVFPVIRYMTSFISGKIKIDGIKKTLQISLEVLLIVKLSTFDTILHIFLTAARVKRQEMGPNDKLIDHIRNYISSGLSTIKCVYCGCVYTVSDKI